MSKGTADDWEQLGRFDAGELGAIETLLTGAQIAFVLSDASERAAVTPWPRRRRVIERYTVHVEAGQLARATALWTASRAARPPEADGALRGTPGHAPDDERDRDRIRDDERADGDGEDDTDSKGWAGGDKDPMKALRAMGVVLAAFVIAVVLVGWMGVG